MSTNKFVIKLPHGDYHGDYLADEEGVKVFSDEIDAGIAVIKEMGFKAANAKRYVRENAVYSIGTCFRCGSPLFPSDIHGYESQCFTCDEDFCSFEQSCERSER